MSTEVSIPQDADMGAMVRASEQQLHDAHKIAMRLNEFVKNSDLQPLDLGGKKPHLWFESWQFLGKFCGMYVRIVETKPCKGLKGEGWEAHAEVVNDAGTVIGGGDAMCLNSESNWKRKDEYQLRGMAQTRACARALRHNLAWIVQLAGYSPTPAEEMDGHGTNAVKPPREELAGIVRGMEDGAVSYLVSVEWLPKGRTLADLDEKHVRACVNMSSKFIDAITKHMNGPHDYRNDPRPLNEIPESEVEELF